MWGIQIGKVGGKFKMEGVEVADEAAGNDTASTAAMPALDSDKDRSDSLDDKAGAEENMSCKGPVKILHKGYGTLTRTKILREVAARLKSRRGNRSQDEAMSSTEVVKNGRHNKCLPSSARLVKAAKTGDGKATIEGDQKPESTTTDFP